jgi:hypothetical protein
MDDGMRLEATSAQYVDQVPPRARGRDAHQESTPFLGSVGRADGQSSAGPAGERVVDKAAHLDASGQAGVQRLAADPAGSCDDHAIILAHRSCG